MKRVAVLRGGPSEEYHVSMKTGKAVLAALDVLNYPHKDIVISKNGDWLDGGFVRTPQQSLEAVDVVFVGLHGSYGEDGQVQRILQRKVIPFTGTTTLSSAIAFNKDLTKRTLEAHGISLPKHKLLRKSEYNILDCADLSYFFDEIGPELFVKPAASGSSFGASYIPHEAALEVALRQLFEQYEEVLIEEFIRGREATVGVLESYRDETLYTLPAIEIVPPSGKPLFSHQDKYSGLTEEIIPGRFSYGERVQLADMARMAHQAIGCRQYSRSDFIVRDGQPYFLEINTLPGLTSESLYPKAASSIGLEFPQLVAHLVETARH